MPFICLRRSDIPNRTLQIVDLWPNVSQRNQSIDPVGQGPLYLRQPQNESASVAVTAQGVETTRAFRGLRAYIHDRVATAGGGLIAPADAADIADGLLTRLADGLSLELADVNAEIDAVSGGATLSGGASTGELGELLRVIAGDEYVVPAGALLEDDNDDLTPQQGAFTEGFRRPVLDTDSLKISFFQGRLRGYRQSDFSYLGTEGAAVTVYNDDGSLYS